MDFEVWKLVFWGIGALGIGGMIAVAILFPAAALAIGKMLDSVLVFLLGTRLGCALLAAIVVGIAVDYIRHSHDDAVFAAENAAFQAAQVKRDKDIADSTRADVYKQLEQDAKDDAETDQQVKDFTDAQPPVPHTTDMPPAPESAPAGPDPLLVGNDACRLRVIAGIGQAQCGSHGGSGVPKARATAKGPRHPVLHVLPKPRGTSARKPQ